MRVSIATTLYRDNVQGWPIVLMLQIGAIIIFVAFLAY